VRQRLQRSTDEGSAAVVGSPSIDAADGAANGGDATRSRSKRNSVIKEVGRSAHLYSAVSAPIAESPQPREYQRALTTKIRPLQVRMTRVGNVQLPTHVAGRYTLIVTPDLCSTRRSVRCTRATCYGCNPIGAIARSESPSDSRARLREWHEDWMRRSDVATYGILRARCYRLCCPSLVRPRMFGRSTRF